MFLFFPNDMNSILFIFLYIQEIITNYTENLLLDKNKNEMRSFW